MTVRAFPTDGPRVRYHASSFCREYTTRDAAAGSRDFTAECSGFGYTGEHPIHAATDLFTDEGRPWIAVEDGIVLSTGQNARGGNTLLYRGDSGRTYYYAHGATPALVRRRDRIRAGQVVGRVGHSGATRVDHLHLSARGPDGRPVDLYAELRAAQQPADSPTWTLAGGPVSSGAPPLPELPQELERGDDPRIAAAALAPPILDLGAGVRIAVYAVGLAVAAVAVGAVS